MSDVHDDGRAEFARLRDKLLDSISDAVSDTEWGPSDEDPAVLSEVVVVMGWVRPTPGQYAVSYFRTGSTWSSKGLVAEALEMMESSDAVDSGEDS